MPWHNMQCHNITHNIVAQKHNTMAQVQHHGTKCDAMARSAMSWHKKTLSWHNVLWLKVQCHGTQRRLPFHPKH